MARLGTRDLARAAAFYDGLAETLGASRIYTSERAISYRGAEGSIFVIGLPLEGEANVGNGTQLSFAAASCKMVDAAYAKALGSGATSAGTPAGNDTDGFYAGYIRDPDGNKLMLYRAG